MTATDAQVTADRFDDATDASADGAQLVDAVVVDRGAVDDRAMVRDAADAGETPVDVPTAADVTAADVTAADVTAADVTAADTGLADVREVDASVMDTPVVDAGAPDVPRDVPAADTGATDAPRADTGADVPRDAPVVDAGCTGAAPVITVTAPVSAAEIETCTESGIPVYYDFAAGVAASAPVRSVSARWINPDGLEAPPSATLSAGPYAFRRQVGGPSTGTPALSVFGIRGSWRVEFTAADACGRSATASRTFSLIFTTRRCPNP